MKSFKGPDGQEDMPYLLLPGPVTTSRAVKFAMLADYGLLDKDFVALTRNVKQQLLQLVHAPEDATCILMPGNETTLREAVIGSVCPAKRKKTLVISNGTDGDEAARIFERAGKPCIKLAYRGTSTIKPADISKALTDDRNISHVWLVHCETSTGMINAVEDIAPIAKSLGRSLVLDATATLGGHKIDMATLGIDVILTRPDACLESIPGVGMVVANNNALDNENLENHAYSLDLRRVDASSAETLPTHAVSALHQALFELQEEGGIDGRSKRYAKTADALRSRLKALGCELFLPDSEASTILQVVHAPKTPRFSFKALQSALRERGFMIAPGTLPLWPSYRIGCTGKLDETVMLKFIEALDDVMHSMDLHATPQAAQ
jgi:2-aminoethylphosphonate-pyruvate transaminase